MYCEPNFKTKKALREAVKKWNDAQKAPDDIDCPTNFRAQPVTIWQPGPFGGHCPRDGEFSVEGPHYPRPHTWYARVTLKDGRIIKVR